MIFRRQRVVSPEMITVPRADWLALCDSVRAQEASRVLGDQPTRPAAQRRSQAAVERLSDTEIEQLLEAHYKLILGSAEGRKMWRRLLAQASAVETVAKIKKS